MKTGSGMVEYARQYLGTPYFYGSKIPEGLLTENDIDRICGPGTVTAILAYQRSCKITADGLAGKTTRKYLSAA